MRLLMVPSTADGMQTSGIAVPEMDGFVRAVATNTVDRVASFTQLAEDHLDAAYALATVILGDRGEAEDATHDAVVKAFRPKA